LVGAVAGEADDVSPNGVMNADGAGEVGPTTGDPNMTGDNPGDRGRPGKANGDIGAGLSMAVDESLELCSRSLDEGTASGGNTPPKRI